MYAKTMTHSHENKTKRLWRHQQQQWKKNAMSFLQTKTKNNNIVICFKINNK